MHDILLVWFHPASSRSNEIMICMTYRSCLLTLWYLKLSLFSIISKINPKLNHSRFNFISLDLLNIFLFAVWLVKPFFLSLTTRYLLEIHPYTSEEKASDWPHLMGVAAMDLSNGLYQTNDDYDAIYWMGLCLWAHILRISLEGKN